MARKSTARAQSGKTILLVDDVQEFLDATRAILEREGHRIITANSGMEALAVLGQEKVDLLLIDFFMPEMTAEDVIVQLRDPSLQVILLTGYSSEKPPREMIARLDIQGYCDKSQGPDELLLWVDVGLKAAATVQNLETHRRGLRTLLGGLPDPRHPDPPEVKMRRLFEQAAEILGATEGFVAVQPGGRLLTAPPSWEEEQPAPLGDVDELQVQVALGPYAEGIRLGDSFSSDAREWISRVMGGDGFLTQDGAAVIPLRCEGRTAGMMLLRPGPDPYSEHWQILEFFAEQMAMTVGESQLSLFSAPGGAYGLTFWKEMALREARAAFRFGHPLSLVLLSALPHEGRTPSSGECGRFLREVVRGTDLAGDLGGGIYAVLLPYTALAGAMSFVRNLGTVHQQSSYLQFQAGISAFHPHGFNPSSYPRPIPGSFFPSTLDTLLSRARHALQRTRDEGGNMNANTETEWLHPAVVKSDSAAASSRPAEAG